MAIGENATTLSLLFKIRSDSSEARDELINTQKFIRQIVRESNAEAGKLGAGLDGGGLKARLANSLGNVKELFAGVTQGARAEIESDGGLRGVFRRFSEGAARDSENVVQSLTNLREGFSGGISNAVAGFGQNLGRASDEGKGLASTLPLATVAAGALAVGVIAAGVGLVKMAISAAELAGRLQDARDEIGLDIRTLAALDAASQVAGVGFDTITRGVATFQDRLDSAASGNKKLSASFQALGIDAKKAAEDPQSAYLSLLKNLQGVESQAQRTALAKDTLGAAGQKTLRVAGELIDENGKLRAEYAALADVLSGETVAALDALDRQWQLLQVTARTALVSIASKYAPDLIIALRDVTGLLVGATDEAGAFGRSAAGAFGEAIISARELKFEISKVVEGFSLLDQAARPQNFDFAKIKAGFSALAEGVVGNAKQIREDFLAERKKLVEELKRQAEEDEKRGRGTRRPVGSGKSGQDTTTRDRLRQLEAGLREEESIFRSANEALKRAFDARLIDEQDYTNQLIEAAEFRQRAVLLTLTQEQVAVENSKLKPRDKTKELEAIAARKREIERETENERAKIDEDAQKRRDQLAQQLEQARLETIRAGLARERALIEGAVNDRLLSNEAGERALTEIARREIELRIAGAQAEIENARNNTAEKELALEKLKALLEDLAAFEEASLRRIGAARQKDLDDLRAYVEGQKRLREQLRDAQVDALDRSAGNLERRAQNQPAFRDDAIRARTEAEQEALDLDHERSLQRLADDRAEQLSRTTTVEQIFEVEQTFNDLRLAEEQRFQDESRSLREQSRAEQLSFTFDPAAADAIAAIEEMLERQLTLWEQLQVAAQSYSATLQTAAANAWARATDIVGTFQRAMSKAIDVFVSSGGSLKAAGKAIAQALASPLIEAAKVEAQFQAAKAIAALAVGDFRGAFLHGLAAAGFAALAAVGTSLTSGALGGASAAASGSSAGSELRRDEERREPEDSRFRFGDATGRLNDPDRDFTSKLNQSFVGQVLDRMRGTLEENHRLIEEQRALQARQLAATEAGVAVTEALTSKIASMAPEDVLAIGAERAPGTIAEGVRESLIRDAGFTRTLAENLRLS